MHIQLDIIKCSNKEATIFSNQAKMRLLLIFILSIVIVNVAPSLDIDNIHDFYTLHVRDSRGNTISLSRFRGKVSLVTNVASECGYTDTHYETYVKMQNIFNKNRHLFNILAFPCNQFGQQEPHSTAHIIEWAKNSYDASFPIFEKVDVIGDDAAFVFQYLAKKSGHTPNWNFWKYLISPTGQVITAWGPRVNLLKIFHIIKEHVEKLNGEEIKDEL